MTQYPDLFAALSAPFEPGEVKTRSQANRSFSYVTARTVMNRLDNVLGPESWSDDYTPLENSVVCRLTIRLPDGQLLTKSDAGGYAGMADQGDDDKSGFSDAFKRAAVKFGIGRYLYNDGSASFSDAPATTPRVHQPEPASSRPGKMRDDAQHPDVQQPAPRPTAGFVVPLDQCPKSGKALYGWLRECGQRYNLGLIAFVQCWGKDQGNRDKMIDWPEEMVRDAYTAAVREILGHPEPDEGDDDRVKAARLMATGSASRPDAQADIPKLQTQLIDVLWKAAAIQSGHAQPNDADYLGTMEMFEHDLGEKLCENSVSDCNDRVRLLRFIGAAHAYVNTQQQRSA